MRSKFICDNCGEKQIKGANSRYCDFCYGGLTRIGKTFGVKPQYSSKPTIKSERKEPMKIETEEIVTAHIDEVTKYGCHVLYIFSEENGWHIKNEEDAKEAAKHYKEISGIELPHQFISDIAESMRVSLKELIKELKRDLADCYKRKPTND